MRYTLPPRCPVAEDGRSPWRNAATFAAGGRGGGDYDAAAEGQGLSHLPRGG